MPDDSAATARAASTATRAFFLILGITTASWAPMVPLAKARLDLDEAHLGLVLLWMGLGCAGATPLAGFLVHRYGNRNVMTISGLLLCLGLVGLGASNIVPVLFSAAGRMPGASPGIAIATVTTLGYVGMLTGPVAIGFLAHATSLPLALGAIAVPLVVVAACAAIAHRGRR